MSEDSKEQAVDNQKPSEELSAEDLKQVVGGTVSPIIAQTIPQTIEQNIKISTTKPVAGNASWDLAKSKPY
jgi:hypothetical protein